MTVSFIFHLRYYTYLCLPTFKLPGKVHEHTQAESLLSGTAAAKQSIFRSGAVYLSGWLSVPQAYNFKTKLNQPYAWASVCKWRIAKWVGSLDFENHQAFDFGRPGQEQMDKARLCTHVLTAAQQ